MSDLVQAIRNEIVNLDRAILQAQGRKGGLIDVLGRLEGLATLDSQPPSGSAGDDCGPVPPALPQGEGEERGAGSFSGSRDGEGEIGGAE